MCFNAPVSLLAFIIGIIGSIRLFMLDFKPEAIFFGWVTLMQIIEFFIWKNQPCNKINLAVTNIGMFINHMEPIVLWMAILIFSKKELPLPVNIILMIFLLFTICYTKMYFKKNKIECTTETPTSTPHLHWKWNYGQNYKLYYGFFLFCLILLSIFGLKDGFVSAFILLLSYFVSYVIYGSTHGFGSIWCFIGALSPWIIPTLHALI
jgi:hypothetical protein